MATKNFIFGRLSQKVIRFTAPQISTAGVASTALMEGISAAAVAQTPLAAPQGWKVEVKTGGVRFLLPPICRRVKY